jgi:hypothetical protein
MLAVTRGRKKLFTLLPLVAVDHSAIVEKYKATPDGDAKTELWDTLSNEQQAAVSAAFN